MNGSEKMKIELSQDLASQNVFKISKLGKDIYIHIYIVIAAVFANYYPYHKKEWESVSMDG